MKRKISMGSDHAGYQLKEYLKTKLIEEGFSVLDHGVNSEELADYPDYAEKVARDVMDERVDFGILICGTGLGMSIAANKFKGIRAALCLYPFMAELARKHNDANILVLSGRLIGRDLAWSIVRTFYSTEFEGGRHEKRIRKILKFEGCEKR